MAFLNLFSQSKPLNGSVLSVPAPAAGSSEVPESVFIEKTNPQPAEPAELNIDLLNKFLGRNLESKGYDDALINPDGQNMQANVQAIKNEFKRTVRSVRQFYVDFLRQIDFHIESRSRRGLVDLVDELKMKRSIAEAHIARINEIETEATEEGSEFQGLVISYERGFRNGLAAISHYTILQKKF